MRSYNREYSFTFGCVMGKDLLSEIINPDDFKLVKSTVLLRNNTSGTEIVDSEQIAIIEISNTSITLRLPQNSCRISHFLDLFIFPYPMKKTISRLPLQGGIKGSLEVIGRVVAITSIDNLDINKKEKEEGNCLTCNCVEIELTQFDAAKWEKFVTQYVEIQDKINRLSGARNS